jgi:hypothetical protein
MLRDGETPPIPITFDSEGLVFLAGDASTDDDRDASGHLPHPADPVCMLLTTTPAPDGGWTRHLAMKVAGTSKNTVAVHLDWLAARGGWSKERLGREFVYLAPMPLGRVTA